MIERKSVFERATIRDVLAFANVARPIDKLGMLRCPLPGHDDSTPSFKIVDERGFICYGCNEKGGVGDLVVALGLASSHADAARWLEEKLDGPPVRPDRYDRPVSSGRGQRPADEPPWRERETYAYRDAHGAVAYEVVRQERTVDGKREKKFTVRTTDENGIVHYSIAGLERVLYRFPEIVRSIPARHTVVVTEGEKDADRLASLGLCATTSAGGAGWKWTEAFVEPLRGAKRIVVIADCDAPGRAAAAKRAQLLATICDDVRVLDLDRERNDGFDVSDWLDAGGTIDGLRALIEATPQFERLPTVLDAVVSAEPDVVTAVEPDRPSGPVIGFPELPPIESASIVAQQSAEPIEYDIEAIAPATDAPILMFGPPASYKSWLALEICNSIVRGVPFIGLRTRKRERALYVNLDAGAKTFRNRVRAISDAPGLDFISLSTTQYSHAVLRRWLEQYRGGFVVLDCLSAIYAPDTHTDPAHAMREFVDGLRALFAEFDCGGIVIDHPHRPKEKGELGDYHGSIQKEAAFRTMWSIVAEKSDDPDAAHRVKIVHRKLSEGPPFSPVEAELDFGERVTITRANGANRDTKRDIIETKILEWGRTQTDAFSMTRVEERVRGHRKTDVRDAFDALIRSHAIVPTGAKRGTGYLYRVACSPSRTDPDGPDGLRNHAGSVVRPEGGTDSDGPDGLVGSPSPLPRPPIGGIGGRGNGVLDSKHSDFDDESSDEFIGIDDVSETANRLRDAARVSDSPESVTPCGFHIGVVGEPCRRCGAAHSAHLEAGRAS